MRFSIVRAVFGYTNSLRLHMEEGMLVGCTECYLLCMALLNLTLNVVGGNKLFFGLEGWLEGMVFLGVKTSGVRYLLENKQAKSFCTTMGGCTWRPGEVKPNLRWGARGVNVISGPPALVKNVRCSN